MTIDWELDHIGIVVKDIDSAVRHYQRAGIALADPRDLNTSHMLNSDSISCLIQNDAIRIKLIQPSAAKGLFRNYLNKHGEGVNYMAFQVNDLQKEKDRLLNSGISIINNMDNHEVGNIETFVDTSKFGNVNIALLGQHSSPPFKPKEAGWKLWHLGFTVKDIQKFAEFYQLIGFKLLAPPFLGKPSPAVLARWTFYGKASPYGQSPAPFMQSWMCHLQNRQGTFLMAANQLVESQDGGLHELLDRHGQPSEGVQHIHFLVEDLPKEMSKMIANGFPCIMTQKRPDGSIHESFYNTREIGNVCIATWSGPPSVKAAPLEEKTGQKPAAATNNTYDFYKNG